jgi:tRNA pseudouridine13 synthase
MACRQHELDRGVKGGIPARVTEPRTSTPREPLLPTVVPFDALDLPGTGGDLGPEPADFCVDEVPLYAPSGEGEHVYVRLEKTSATTSELVSAVARAAHVAERDIGVAGQKDKHAITTQWLSVPHGAEPPETWVLPPHFRLLEHTRHGNKLRTGHLKGNRFRIRLVDTQADALSAAEGLVARLNQVGLRNFFGAQRFGAAAHNLSRALETLRAGRWGRLAPNQRKFNVSVIQSEVFNRYLCTRAELGLERVLEGDVVRLAGSQSVFLVEDVAAVQSRLDARDVFLTGPIAGPKTRSSAGVPLELERAAMAPLELSEAELALLGRDGPGTRRDLIVLPSGLTAHAPSKSEIILEFELGAGSYATQVIRLFTRTEPRAAAGGAGWPSAPAASPLSAE